MFRKLLGACVLLVTASSAWGYQVSAFYDTTRVQQVEGDGSQTVTVQVVREASDAPTACLIDVTASAGPFASPPAGESLATAGTDYTPTTTTLTIDVGANANSVQATFPVPVLDDGVAEPTEAFAAAVDFVVINDCDSAAVFNIAAEASIPIFDDDTANLTLAVDQTTVSVNEDAGTVDLGVTLSGLTSIEGSFSVSVDWQLVAGSAATPDDFGGTATSGTLLFDENTTTQTVTVAIVDDALAEGAEDFDFTLSNVSGVRPTNDPVQVTLGPATTNVQIVDNEAATTTSFSTTQASATEDSDTVALTLVRGGSTTGAVSVDYATQDGTATAGEDYVAAAGTVFWADGDGADKTITIQLLGDTTEEQAEDFLVVLSNVTGNAALGSNSTITVTIDASDQTRDISAIPNLTPNQRALANWFDQTCGRLAALPSPTPAQQNLIEVCGVVRGAATGDDTVRAALDTINPEELLVTAFTALRLTAVQHGNVAQRLNALRNGARGVDLAGLDLQVNGQQIAGNALQTMFDELVGGGASADENVWGHWGVFVSGRIATGDKDRTDNEAGFDFDLYSVTTGVDYRIRDNFIIGVSAGFGTVDSDFQQGTGGLDIDSWNAGAYLTYFRDESFYFDALATYGNNDYDSERTLSFAGDTGTFSGTTRGSTDGDQYSVGFGTGWDFSHGGFTFGPHGGAYYFDVDVDSFAESGVLGLELDIGDQSTESFTVNAGAHASYAWLTGWGVLVPNVKVDWVHEFEDNAETLAFSFINDPFAGDPNDPSPTITLRSDRPDSNYFIWSVGASAQFVYGFSGFVNYQSYAGYDNVDIGEWAVGARWEKTW